MSHQHTPPESSVAKNVTATIAYHSGPALPTSPIAGVTTLEDCTQQVVAVTDIRPSVSSFTLDGNGFQVVKHVSAVSSLPYDHSSWTDPVVRSEVYDPEIIELAKSITGAKNVMILLASSRNVPFKEPELAPPYPMPSKAKGFQKGEEEGPMRKPHKDWGPSGAWNTLRNWSQELVDEAADITKAGDEAAELPGGRANNYQGRRWALYITWCPLKPVKRDPMAYVDYWTADEEDSVSFWRNPPGMHGTFESDVLLTKANTKHKWYWISDQTPDEVLLMKIMDTESEKDGSDIARGVHHCSFHLPGTDKEEVRESIETKFIAFW
ncbi:GA4 desaturase [Fusarium agapanthi]|uniref:GA4 desaturase n=1 Tax=Fusarium agapanthi TaxID=1803897 RepID=A0A9P5BFD8_9HYPO|nr:GA4 desaturase [Fusarium agapanthi]